MNVYINEDGEAWVPVAEATREEAEPFAREAVGCEPSDTITYHGVVIVPVHEDEHYDWDDARCAADGCREAVECHHFEWEF